MPDMAQLAFRGGQISFEVSGTGKAVVFLHGFLENKEIWSDLIHALEDSYRIVSIDLPGHGSTSSFGYSHSMDFMASAVMAVLKHLKLRRCRFIGHSMGGYVAMAFADQYADYVAGICLFHSTVSDDPPAKKKEREKLIKLVQRDKNLFIREAIPNLFNLAFKPYKQVIARHIKTARQIPLQGIIAALEGMKNRPDRRIILRFAPYPVLYIIGRHDNVLPYTKLMDECAQSEKIRYAVLENTGHMGFIEEREGSIAALKGFLAGT